MRIKAAVITTIIAAMQCAATPVSSQPQQSEPERVRPSEPGAKTLSDPASMRLAAESVIRNRLVDPESAIFEWPYGFMKGRWPTILKSRFYDGEITCGLVNAKNRLGGYTGKVFFVVVFNNGSLTYSDIGTGKGRGRDFVGDSCLKSAPELPAN
ncbi:hypothetical protein [Sphingomonas sp.]|uniref:hypothetical protein n=1 Tax=Sphingomonas sp. TaxID=28214 RepID=UPI0028A0728F|nr:hypothetical protein [Sphingomonas sp.]